MGPTLTVRNMDDSTAIDVSEAGAGGHSRHVWLQKMGVIFYLCINKYNKYFGLWTKTLLSRSTETILWGCGREGKSGWRKWHCLL